MKIVAATSPIWLKAASLFHFHASSILLATIMPVFFAAGSAFAGSATWSTAPSNGNWNSAPNWSPMTVPNGPADIARLLSFDQLMVAGTASLNGTLDVILDGYTGHAGDIFTILTSSGLIGNFGTFDLPTLDNGLFFTESRTSNNVLLTVNAPANLPDHGSTLLLMAVGLAMLFSVQQSIISRLAAA